MEGDDSITFTMAEFGEFQSELLNLKHENARLKSLESVTNSEKTDESILNYLSVNLSKESFSDSEHSLIKALMPLINLDKFRSLETENEEYKKQLEEATSNAKMQALEYDNLKKSLKNRFQELYNANERVGELETELTKTQESLKKATLEIEDAKTEKLILKKRSMHDLQDLKAELASEKTAHSQCKVEKEHLVQEIRRLNDAQKNTNRSNTAATKEEKIIVEDLCYRVNELANEVQTKNKELEIERQEKQELTEEVSALQLHLANLGSQINEIRRTNNLT